MNSLEITDRASEAVATHPRVRLADIEAAICERYDFRAAEALHAAIHAGATRYKGNHNHPVAAVELEDERHPLQPLSICILVMRNGFTVIGKAAPASPENFDPALGRQYAYEDAVRQLWPLMGYALRDRLQGTRGEPGGVPG